MPGNESMHLGEREDKLLSFIDKNEGKLLWGLNTLHTKYIENRLLEVLQGDISESRKLGINAENYTFVSHVIVLIGYLNKELLELIGEEHAYSRDTIRTMRQKPIIRNFLLGEKSDIPFLFPDNRPPKDIKEILNLPIETGSGGTTNILDQMETINRQSFMLFGGEIPPNNYGSQKPEIFASSCKFIPVIAPYLDKEEVGRMVQDLSGNR